MDAPPSIGPVLPLHRGPAAFSPPTGRPPVRRAYGVVVLLSAVVWAAAIALFGTVYLVALFSVVASIDPGSTDPGAAPPDLTGPLATSIVLAVIWIAGALISVALDIAATIMSIQRLVRRVGDAVVPWCTLAALTVSWLLPLLCVGILLVVAYSGSSDLTPAAVWICSLAVYLAVPLSRLVQGIVGIVRTATGETPHSSVGPLP